MHSFLLKHAFFFKKKKWKLPFVEDLMVCTLWNTEILRSFTNCLVFLSIKLLFYAFDFYKVDLSFNTFVIGLAQLSSFISSTRLDNPCQHLLCVAFQL